MKERIIRNGCGRHGQRKIVQRNAQWRTRGGDFKAKLIIIQHTRMYIGVTLLYVCPLSYAAGTMKCQGGRGDDGGDEGVR